MLSATSVSPTYVHTPFPKTEWWVQRIIGWYNGVRKITNQKPGNEQPLLKNWCFPDISLFDKVRQVYGIYFHVYNFTVCLVFLSEFKLLLSTYGRHMKSPGSSLAETWNEFRFSNL